MARLKGLDEFEAPEFVGRMDRIVLKRKLGWWAMMTGGFVAGVSLGLIVLN